MKILYSFVIDENPNFNDSARIITSTLFACGVPVEQIVVHLTPKANHDAVEYIAKNRLKSVKIPFGPDKRFTNKIMQMFSEHVKYGDYDILALCDTDLAFVESIESYADKNVIRARRVDGPNPPLDILNVLAEAVNFQRRPGTINTTCVEEPTYDRNCNGGLLLIPRSLVYPLSISWLNYAKFLTEKAHLFGRWINNIDQVAWAFALSSLDLPFKELPIELNFPTCIAGMVPGGYGKPIVLHHHHDFDERKRIKMTGVPIVDEAIAWTNACSNDYTAV